MNLLLRVFKSLKNVCIIDDLTLEILLKFITAWNLFKKGFHGGSASFTVWPFRECLAQCNFEGIKYIFLLSKGYDSNIYLNPFFHEYDITQFVAHSLNEGDIFIDVGAHAGLYTLIASLRVGPQGKVLSFEPHPLNFAFLKRNIELNMLSNVILVPKAASDKPERLQLYYSPHNTALSSIFEYEGGKRSVSVEAVRIDDIIDENNLSSVKIMKVDTEGYDFNVLKGSKNTLSKTQYVIVEQNIPDTRKLLSDCGFKLSNFKPSGYLLATNKSLISE